MTYSGRGHHGNRGRIHAPEVVEANRARRRAEWADPVKRDLRVAAMRAAYRDPEIKTQIIAKRSAGLKKGWAKKIVLMAGLPLWREHVERAEGLMGGHLTRKEIASRLRSEARI